MTLSSQYNNSSPRQSTELRTITDENVFDNDEYWRGTHDNMVTIVGKESVTFHIHKTTNNTMGIMGKMNIKLAMEGIHNSTSGLERSRFTSRSTMYTSRTIWMSLQDQLRQSTCAGRLHDSRRQSIMTMISYNTSKR
eukprot:3809184-Amphidinium_carterae.2